MSYDNTNSGALFKNEKKTAPNQPDYRGNINVDGIDKDISAWIKKSKPGKAYMSIAVQDPWKKEATQNVQQDQASLDDSIPF